MTDHQALPLPDISAAVRARLQAMKAGQPTEHIIPIDLRRSIHNGHVGQVVVFCDRTDCDVQDIADYTGATREDRFATARRYLTDIKGWRCDPTGDWCPDDKNNPDTQPLDPSTLNGFTTYRRIRVTAIGDDDDTLIAVGHQDPLKAARAFRHLAHDTLTAAGYPTPRHAVDDIQHRWAVFTGTPGEWTAHITTTGPGFGLTPVTVLDLT